MPSWDVRPGVARAVIGRAEGEASEFAGQRTGLSSALASSGAAPGPVAEALARLARVADEEARFLVERSEAAVTGARTAVGIYVAGDEEMAGNARKNQAAAPSPGAPGGEGREVAASAGVLAGMAGMTVWPGASGRSGAANAGTGGGR